MSMQLLILSGFLIFSLIYGFLASSGVHTFKKFAVGDKNFTTTALVATLVATRIGAGTLFLILEHTYVGGLFHVVIFVVIGKGMMPLIMSRRMIVCMQKFLKHLSIAESMGVLFGNKVRIITALSGLVWCAGIVGIQLQYLTKSISYFFNIKEGTLLLYSALTVLLLYAMRGGIRAVTATDLVQFITFIAFLLTMIYLVSRHIYSFKALSQIWNHSSIFPHIKQISKWEAVSTLLIFVLIAITYPSTIQRFYMATDLCQAKRTFTYAYGIIIIMLSLVAMLALFLRVHHPNLDSNELLLLDYLLSLYPSDAVNGFAAISIVSLAMSTADSCVHTASLLFTNDLAPFLKLPSDNKNQLLQARIATCITGIVALLLVLYQRNSWNLLLFISSLYISVVPIPFMLAVFGFRPRTKSVLWGMGAGLMTTISFHVFGLDSYLHITFQSMQTIIASLMHLLFLLGSRCLYSNNKKSR